MRSEDSIEGGAKGSESGIVERPLGKGGSVPGGDQQLVPSR
jgi:hypothetical protein